MFLRVWSLGTYSPPTGRRMRRDVLPATGRSRAGALPPDWPLRSPELRPRTRAASGALETYLHVQSFESCAQQPKFEQVAFAAGQSFRSPFAAKADVAIARAIARDTKPAPEEIARVLTWGADEKVLLVLAAAGWLGTRRRGEPLRRAGNHALLVTVAASLLPHALKAVFDQTRPDRRTVLGHLHGISFSGKRDDAFPSGHALHMGALASAAGTLPADPAGRSRRLPSVFPLRA